ncbi:MAG: GNAT family N-acetyltransferase [Bacteroidales bacterium]|nr:GNAT family N-acetyltransferase [Bacteroidales bacterium]MBR1799449.1 GNAT family N-acetyltransferase [Bacteroidales bacterium]
MITSNIERIDPTQWDELLTNSSTASWHQSFAAYRFFSSQKPYIEPFIFAYSRNGSLKAIVSGYLTNDYSGIKRRLSRRAIIMGGPLLANDIEQYEVASLLSTLINSLKRECIYIETRNFSDYSTWNEAFSQAHFTYAPHLNFHIDTSSPTLVESQMSKKLRRKVRTSFSEGATVITQPTNEQVTAWYTILQHLYHTKVKTPLFPLSFFLALNNEPTARYTLIEYEGDIVGGTLCMVLEGKTAYEWFACGNNQISNKIHSSCVATYASIMRVMAEGCSRYDMMGAGRPNEAYGVRDFKAQFGGSLVQHGRYLHINRPLLYNIGRMAISIIKHM